MSENHPAVLGCGQRGVEVNVKILLGLVCALMALGGDAAGADIWQPAPGHEQIPIWPGPPPDAQPVREPESVASVDRLIAERPYKTIRNVSLPTMTVYSPKGSNTGAAVVVLPGGSFVALAIDLEGTEVCDWLTPRGITCVLLKYRVPTEPFDWRCRCYPDGFTTSTLALQDVQRTIGLMRLRAKDWHIDPRKIGVMGFSAGGFLAAAASTRFRQRLYAPQDDADKESARPDYAVLIYPGRLATDDDRLNPNLPVSGETSPTFLIHAENDRYGMQRSLVYYGALKKAGVPAEMHIYAEGGHAFGVRPGRFPITDWPRLAEIWLRTIGMIPR